MIKSKRFLVLFALLFIVVAALLCAWFYHYWAHTPISQNRFVYSDTDIKQHTLVLPRGLSLHGAANRLFEKGYIAYPKLWILHAKLTSQTAIKSGEYAIDVYHSPDEILKKLIKGDVVYHSVQFIEGQTFKEVLQSIHKQKGIVKKLNLDSVSPILKQLNINIDHPEGWFFPDTYYYSLGETDISVLRRAHQKMQNVLNQYWQKRAPNLPYKSNYEALIMASIIEKETGAAFERADIAGVFINRLNKNMRLQTDPTVIYGMGDAYKGDIKRKHLKIPTPYNTYTIEGLPPTPIAMPSEMAIKAALNPNTHNLIYFVGKGDGTHHFSVTLEEHNKAVQKYQLKRDNNYRSSIK